MSEGVGETRRNLTLDRTKLQKGREVCPSCGRKGLGYANHPHAFGYKDHERASCRYCKATFSKSSNVEPSSGTRTGERI